MTDYSHLIGPEPTPAPSPKFPTPWEAVGHQVQAANLNLVLNITHLRTDRGDQEALAAFIAEAVNEKVARDSFRPITITDGNGGIWTLTEEEKYSNEAGSIRDRTKAEIEADFGIRE